MYFSQSAESEWTSMIILGDMIFCDIKNATYIQGGNPWFKFYIVMSMSFHSTRLTIIS